MLADRLAEACSTLASRRSAWPMQHQERGNEAYALHLLGDIAAHADPPIVRRPQPTTSKPSP